MEAHPATLGPYLLDARLASAATGVVLRAYASSAQTPVVLKIPTLDLQIEPTFQERFFETVVGLKGLMHPNVVRLIESGELLRLVYAAFAWEDGMDLEALLAAVRARSQPLSLQEVLTIATRVGRALEAIGRHGARSEGPDARRVYGVLRPSKVLVTTDGAIRLIPLSIVALDPRERAPRTPRQVAWTPPEADRGAPLTPAADVWALAVLVLTLLLGDNPFLRAAPADTAAARSAPLQLPADELRFPPALTVLLRKCLSPDPAVRPARPVDLLASLSFGLTEVGGAVPPALLRDRVLRLRGAGDQTVTEAHPATSGIAAASRQVVGPRQGDKSG